MCKLCKVPVHKNIYLKKEKRHKKITIYFRSVRKYSQLNEVFIKIIFSWCAVFVKIVNPNPKIHHA